MGHRLPSAGLIRCPAVDLDERTVTEPTDRILLPPAPPRDVLAMIAFTTVMDARMRQLRDEGALPRSAMTLPDEFDDLIVEMNERVRGQAQEALDAGRSLVTCWHPRSGQIDALVAWMHPRIKLMEGIIRAGMVHDDWQKPLMLLQRFWTETVRQVNIRATISEGYASH